MTRETPGAVKVLVVDDHPVVREGLRSMLSRDPEIDVVAEASDGVGAIEQVKALGPDVVLTDIRMPGMSGIDVTREIKSIRPKTAIIVLTMYDSEMYVVEALRVGAAGYLLKDSSRELLCHAIHAVVDGGTMVRSGLLRQAVQGVVKWSQSSTGESDSDSQVERLTAREMEVLQLVALGYANRDIARELHLAEVTVKKYVQSIIAKLNASDRTHAAILSIRLGLVE